jgi:hypothetical protein
MNFIHESKQDGLRRLKQHEGKLCPSLKSILPGRLIE